MSLQKIITFLTSYSLVVSFLYLLGFWGTFGVNILEYITLSDILKNALLPLLYSSFVIVAGIAIGNILVIPLSKAMPPGAGADLPQAKYFRWFIYFYGIFLFVAIIYQIFFEIGHDRWFIVAVLLFLPLSIAIGDASFAEKYFQHKRLRIVIVNILCSILLYAFGWGAIDAKQVKKNAQILKINGVISEYYYIGWAGDFLFLWNDNESTVVIRSKVAVDSIERGIPKEYPIIDFSD